MIPPRTLSLPWLRMLLLGTTLALAPLFGHTAAAENLLTITGPGDTGQSFDSNETVATSFVLTLAATDVTISAPILGFGATGTLWLTNQIGTGTTIGNVIAGAPYSSANGTPTFTGLSLAPGTYFFVLAIDTGFAIWPASTVPTITGNPAAAAPGLDFRSNDTDDSFPPESDFNVIFGAGRLHFSVTGTIVPEPGTWVLLIAGAGMLVACRRRAKERVRL